MDAEVAIVGAGFAGAATAYHLSRRLPEGILIIDRESVPGFHASGRNASLILQSVASGGVRAAVAASREFFARNRDRLGFESVGSVLLGSREALETRREPQRVASFYESPDDLRRRLPQLVGHDFEAALSTPSDGVIDIGLLLGHYLRGARDRGVELSLDCDLLAIEGEGPFRLRTSRGTIDCSRLINAAGAWAPALASMAGTTAPPLVPWKRHLFVLDQVVAPAAGMPFVWDIEHQFYFRPESGGYLFSVCDEERSESLEPTVEPAIELRLAATVEQWLPAFAEATVRNVWSCFRTRTADDRPLIGWDPEIDGLFWVAGLGGHGVGSSWEVGRLAASRYIAGVERGAARQPGPKAC